MFRPHRPHPWPASRILLALPLLLLACEPSEVVPDVSPTPVLSPTPLAPVDGDQDGFYDDVDCDDSNPSIHPGAQEVCNGLDDDCDGELDDDASDPRTFYTDSDKDGYGNALAPVRACSATTDYVSDRTDCDDTNAQVNPGQAEICGDGLDNNCDGGAGDCGLGGIQTLDQSDFSSSGVIADDRAGCSVSPAGDVNGDGFQDLLVGAYLDDAGGSNAGAAFLLLGPFDGERSLADADAKFVGEESLDRAGASVAGVGDVNADGFDDVLIGAYYNDRGGKDSGAAYLFYGPVSGIRDLSSADAILVGEVTNGSGSSAGYTVMPGGDINGDGKADLLVGAYYYSSPDTSWAGASYVVYGPVTGVLPLANASARILGDQYAGFSGYALAGAGDLNGDGKDDVVIGAWGTDTGGPDSGTAYVFNGPLLGTLQVANANGTIRGAAGEELGRSVSIVGDINGDGRADLLLGAPAADSNGTDSGSVYLFLGPVTGTTTSADAFALLKGEVAGSELGETLSPAGDINQDGFDDLLIGARGKTQGRTSSHAAYLVYGPVSGESTLDASTAAARFSSTDPAELVGYEVTGGRDFSGDGILDVVLGVPQKDGDSAFPGRVYGFVGGAGL